MCFQKISWHIGGRSLMAIQRQILRPQTTMKLLFQLPQLSATRFTLFIFKYELQKMNFGTIFIDSFWFDCRMDLKLVIDFKFYHQYVSYLLDWKYAVNFSYLWNRTKIGILWPLTLLILSNYRTRAIIIRSLYIF